MENNFAATDPQERVALALRELYAGYGYRPYRMSKFEEYDLYSRHKDFLVSDGVITFTDTNGKLMALKPDVTLSIIKNSADRPDLTEKLYYSENVYRVSKRAGTGTPSVRCCCLRQRALPPWEGRSFWTFPTSVFSARRSTG